MEGPDGLEVTSGRQGTHKPIMGPITRARLNPNGQSAFRFTIIDAGSKTPNGKAKSQRGLNIKTVANHQRSLLNFRTKRKVRRAAA